jgi:hypothetical protein
MNEFDIERDKEAARLMLSNLVICLVAACQELFEGKPMAAELRRDLLGWWLARKAEAERERRR